MIEFGEIKGWKPPVKRRTVHQSRIGKKGQRVEVAKKTQENKAIKDILDTLAEDERRKGAWARHLRDPNPD